jgi:hypothetical protein
MDTGVGLLRIFLVVVPLLAGRCEDGDEDPDAVALLLRGAETGRVFLATDDARC